jgi:hypothetical protein
MKESYSEGLAHHTGPESWGGAVRYPRGGAAVQALTGETASLILSREISVLWDADAVSLCSARLTESHAVLELERAAKPTTRKSGEPVASRADGCSGRIGKPKGSSR